nr:MAG: ORF1 [Torque teno midi virus]
MPFWWRRRRRPWFGTWRKRRFTRRQRRRKYKYPRRRWRRRRTTRRRRRRRGKVRRKKQKLFIQQWQPDSITLCKIKGFGELILGSEGTQYLCYTNQKYDWTPPLMPGGGGFGAERFTLSYLYDQHIARHNIWTKTNQNKDLCRYLKATFYFFRHPEIDFIVQYSRQPPFNIDKTTYPSMHPLLLMLTKHHRFIPSLKTKPRGKKTVKITIKPPKQMLNKWFFTQQFCQYDLLQIVGSTCSLSYPRIAPTSENRIITIFYLNPDFFQDSTWAHVETTKPYEPYQNISHNLTYYGPYTGSSGYKPNYWDQTTTTQGQYYASVSRTDGFFSKKILTATSVKKQDQQLHEIPVRVARYNPTIDNGKGNKIWLTSIVGDHYAKPSEDTLLFENTPLWLAFYGWWSYIQKLKDKSFFNLHMFVIQSDFIKPPPDTATRQYFPFIDYEFTQGNNPNKSPYSYLDNKAWYPTAFHQVQTINSIVETGAYVPKLSEERNSNWELPYKYCFSFKWGGPQIFDEQVDNPKDKNKYNVPDTFTQRIQISNPLKQTTESILHEWDYRRGFITNKALKRMSENILTDTDFQTDTESPEKKRQRVTTELHNPEEKNKEIKRCLLSLCESSSSQEEEEKETPNLLKLINKQHLKQQQLKLNILKLIKDLKAKQRMLQLQSGVLE